MRTLCVDDLPPVELTHEELIEDGWEHDQILPNGEMVYRKQDLIGFLNRQSGRFVSCKYRHEFEKMFRAQWNKYYRMIGYVYAFDAWRDPAMLTGCME